MLNNVVPTWPNDAVWDSVLALIANTSVSGRLKRTELSHTRPTSSSQCPSLLLNLTIMETNGAVSPLASVPGPRCPPTPVSPLLNVHAWLVLKVGQIRPSLTTVVWFPVLNPAI